MGCSDWQILQPRRAFTQQLHLASNQQHYSTEDQGTHLYMTLTGILYVPRRQHVVLESSFTVQKNALEHYNRSSRTSIKGLPITSLEILTICVTHVFTRLGESESEVTLGLITFSYVRHI